MDASLCYEDPMQPGMTYRIMRGHSIQQVDLQTVIFDHLGYRWHTFDGIVPMEAALAVVAAYKTGVEEGRKQADAEAGGLRAVLKRIATLATN